MLGRAVVIAAGTLLVAGTAAGQQSETPPPPQQIQGPAEAGPKPLAAEPDPLTPPEVKGPPPAAPAVQAQTAPAAPAPVDQPVVEEIRRRLSAAGARSAAADPADRAALAAHYETPSAFVAWTDASGFTLNARLALDELRNADNWGLKASSFDLPLLAPGAPSTDARADAEIKLGLAILKYARQARGGRVNPGSISQLNDRKPQPFEPRSLIDSATKSNALDAYLRGLHPKHAGFLNLQKALVAARTALAEPAPAPQVTEPATQQTNARGKQATAKRSALPASRADTIQRIVVNMERWRWMPDDLGTFHVWNNIPDQITTTVKDGKAVFTERIVVGKPDTPTPNFSANMQFVIFQPEWGVPNGIKNNEIAPLLRRASADNGSWFGGDGRTPSTVLARHGLRVSAGGQVINPDNIDWSRVDVNRFNFIQPAGATNVLGVVKFRFPNRHDVYMHDTPQKGLFSSPTRAFSHGCMRVQNPVRFAEVLLEHDKGFTPAQVQAMVPRGTNVTLNKEIPVHNVYFTAMADETGKLRTAGDLYGQDSRIASALEGRSIAVASARGEPGAGGDPSSSEGQPRAKSERPQKQRQASNSQRRSGDSNPFAGLFGN